MAGSNVTVPPMVKALYDVHVRIQTVYNDWLQGRRAKQPEEKFYAFLKEKQLDGLEAVLAATQKLVQVTEGKEGKEEIIWFSTLIEAAQELRTLHELKIHKRAPKNDQERQLVSQTTTMDVMHTVMEKLAQQAKVDVAVSKKPAASASGVAGTVSVVHDTMEKLSLQQRQSSSGAAASADPK